MSKCLDVYLDEYGNTSVVHEKALELYGAEAAESIYIQHMFRKNDIRLSTDEELIKAGEKVLDNMNENLELSDEVSGRNATDEDDNGSKTYIDKETGETVWRASYYLMLLENTKTNSQIEEIRNLMGSGDTSWVEIREAKLKEEQQFWVDKSVYSLIEKRVHKDTGFLDEDLLEATESYIAENENEILELEKFINHKWEAAAIYGTNTHRALELGLNILNDWRVEQRKLPEDQRDEQAGFIHRRANIYDEVKDQMVEENESMNINLSVDGFRNLIESVVDLSEEVEDSWGIPRGTAILRTESRVRSHKLGIGGSVDLMIIDPRNTKNVYLVDFKTKNQDSYKNFFFFGKKKLPKPFEDVSMDPYGKATVQLSIYAAILKDNGFTIRGASVMVIKGYLGNHADQETKLAGDREFFYGGITVENVVDVSLLHHRVINHILGVDFEDNLITKRKNGFQGFIDLWSNNSAKTIRDHRDEAAQKKYDAMTTDKSGKYYYSYIDPDTMVTKRKTITGSKEAMKDLLIKQFKREYDVTLKRKRSNTRTLLSIFRAGKGAAPNEMEHNITKAFKNSSNTVLNALSGIDPNTHTLHLAEDLDPELYGDIGGEVLIAINNETKNISLLLLSSARNNKLYFESEASTWARKRNSIWGRYRTNAFLRARNIKVWYTRKGNPGKAHQLLSLSLVEAAMRYKEKHPSMNVESIKVASVLDGNPSNNITSITMKDGLYMLNKFKEYADPAGEFPVDTKARLDKFTYKDFTDTKYESLLLVLDKMELRRSGLLSSYAYKDLRVDLIEKIEKVNAGDRMILPGLKQDLIIAYDLAMKSVPGATTEAKVTNPEIRILRDALLMTVKIEEEYHNIIGKEQFTLLRSAGTVSDSYANRLEVIREEYEGALRLEFEEFNREHTRLLKALYKDQGIIKIDGPARTRMFKKMLLDDGKFDINHKEHWMQMKDPNAKEFSKAQKDYIIFFNKYVKSGLINATTSKKKKKAIEANDYASDGIIPLLKKSSGIDTRTSTTIVESSLSSLIPASKDQVGDDLEATTEALETKFKNEIDDGAWQFSDSRREALGENGEIGNLHAGNIELNLAVILDMTVQQGLRTKFLGAANTIFNATMAALLDLQVLHPDINTEKVRQFISAVQLMYLHNKYAAEEAVWKGVDKLGQVISSLIFSMSTKQGATEFASAVLKSSSAVFAGFLTTRIFKGDQRFGAVDFMWALRAWLEQGNTLFHKFRTMAHQNGMYMPDSDDIVSNDNTKRDTIKLFRHKITWGLNMFSINTILVVTFMAYARAKGFYKAYVQTEKGHWVYDESLDTRFHVWDEDTGIGTKPTTEEELKKWELWKYNRAEAAAENMLHPDTGKMILPLMSRERKHLKNYATDIYGSMSKDSHILADMFAGTRAMGRFKRWFTRKGAMYYTSRAENDINSIQIWNKETKKWDWASDPAEGIMQSVGYAMEAAMAGEFLNFRKHMSQSQRENFGVLFADAMFFGLMMTLSIMTYKALAEKLKEERKKQKRKGKDVKSHFIETTLGMSLLKGYENAWSELNVLATAYNMNSNIMPAVGAAGNMFVSLFKIGQAILTEDTELLKVSTKSLGGTIAPIRLIGYEIPQLINN